MPVSEHPGYDSYVGNAVTTIFAFTFVIFEESDMMIELDGVAQVLTTDYTISAVGEGGDVTFVTAPGSGVIVNLSGEVSYDRSTDYIDNGDFRAEVVDNDFDRTVVLCQQLAREFGRSFLLSYEDISGVTTLLSTPVASRFLAWNSGATALEYIDPGSVELALPASESVTADMIDTGDTAAIRTKLDVMDTTTLASTYLAKSGGTMLGKIVLDGDGTAVLHPAPIQQIQKNSIVYVVDTGAADVYVMTLVPAIAAYIKGMTLFMEVVNANATTTPTVNVSAKGAKTIKRQGGGALFAGDMPVGHKCIFFYDGTDMILLNPYLHDHSGASQGGYARGIVQTVRTPDSTVNTGTTVMVDDNSPPLIAEGDKYLEREITPTDSANKLIIKASGHFVSSVISSPIYYALYQDSTSECLVSGRVSVNTNSEHHVDIEFEMPAGTTSPTTFQLRAGGTSGTLTFNGNGGSGKFGNSIASYIKVTEVKP